MRLKAGRSVLQEHKRKMAELGDIMNAALIKNLAVNKWKFPKASILAVKSSCYLGTQNNTLCTQILNIIIYIM